MPETNELSRPVLDWERFKQHIYRLYIKQDEPLQQVIRVMRETHGFSASKAQYERQLKKWALSKNVTAKDWKVVGRRIERRKCDGKNVHVHLHHQLLAHERVRRETSRHGHMTAFERFTRGTTPETPPAFEIRTSDYLDDLPILQVVAYQETSTQSVPAVNLEDLSLASLTKMTLTSSSGVPMNVIADAVLPAFVLRECAESGALGTPRHGGTLQALTFAAFLLSNNMNSEMGPRPLYEWLKRNRFLDLLDFLPNVQGPSIESLAENLLRLAVCQPDVPVVKKLIRFGVNIDGQYCDFCGRSPTRWTLFQVACMLRNAELVQTLIQAGVRVVDEHGVLVLAIMGGRVCADLRNEREQYFDGDEDEDENESDEDGDEDEGDDRSKKYGLVKMQFIKKLVGAGADIDGVLCSDPDDDGFIWEQFDYPRLVAGHSPLIAASKAHHIPLVSYLLAKGADIRHQTHYGCTALHECLHDSDVSLDLIEPRAPLANNEIITTKLSTILLAAGADVHARGMYGIDGPIWKWDDGKEMDERDYYGYWQGDLTALDLSVYEGYLSLIELLETHGVHANEESLFIAFCSFDLRTARYLIKRGVPVTGGPVTEGLVKVAVDAWTINPLWPVHNDCTLAKAEEAARLLIEIGQLSIHEMLLIHSVALDIPQLFSDLVKLGIPLRPCSPELRKRLTEGIESCSTQILRTLMHPGYPYRPVVVQCIGRSLYDIIVTDPIWTTERDEFDDSNATTRSGMYRVRLRNLISAGLDSSAESPVLTSAIRRAITLRDKVVFDLLAEAGANVNADESALVRAIQWGDCSVIRTIVETGANLNRLGSFSFDASLEKLSRHDNILGYIRTRSTLSSPLGMAIYNDDWRVFEYLSRLGARVDHSYPDRAVTPLAIAVFKQDFSLLNWLLSLGADPNDMFACHVATKFRRTQIWDLLLAHGADPIAENQFIFNRPGHADTFLAWSIRLGDISTVRSMIRSGALLSSAPWQTALHLTVAISVKKTEVIRLLLDAEGGHHASSRDYHSIITSVGLDGITPLQHAVQIRSPEMVHLLLDYGVDPNILGRDTYRGDVALINVAIAPDERKEHSLEVIGLFLRYGADLNTPAVDKDTALQVAVREGKMDVVRLLLQHGADVNLPPKREYGATAVQFAAIGGWLGIAHLLLEKGADVNASPAEFEGRTALEGAAEHGRIDMLQLLMNAGANTTGAWAPYYQSALRRATQNGHHAARKLLQQYHESRLE